MIENLKVHNIMSNIANNQIEKACYTNVLAVKKHT